MNPGANSHLYLLITYLYLGYAEGARLMLRFGKGSMCSAVRVSERAPRPSHLRVKFLTFPNFPKFQMLLKITSKKKNHELAALVTSSVSVLGDETEVTPLMWRGP